MYKKETTCKCIKNFKCMNSGNLSKIPLEFHKGREYQVDIYPLYYHLWQNGGWNDYICLTKDQFNEYFILIE